MAVLKSIEKNNQGKPLEDQMESSPAILPARELKLPPREQTTIEVTESIRLAEDERARLESLGALGRLKERTLKAAFTLSCNVGESVSLLLLSVGTLGLGLVSERVRDFQADKILKIQAFFDKVCPTGSILSGEKAILKGESLLSDLYGSVKLGFNIITYPSSLVLDVVLGTISTGTEEADIWIKNKTSKKQISYSEYLKQIEEQPSGIRDGLNLLCAFGISLLTLGRGSVPTPIAVRSYKALQLMFPSLAMGLAGATGEQLMRVEDNESGGFNLRKLVSDTIQGALGSGIFMGGASFLKNSPWRNRIDAYDGGQDFFEASGEYQRVDIWSEKISLTAKVARSAGYALKLGTAVYDLKDTNVLERVDINDNHTPRVDEGDLKFPAVTEEELRGQEIHEDGYVISLP
ncbi:MAG: hypothetical protein KBC84_07845, partial [Proteobacteria bacterium]|nr:hypothetical protein [Pseudomonadota bacterium]